MGVNNKVGAARDGFRHKNQGGRMSEHRVNNLLYKFYEAGYESRRNPRPLSSVAVAIRRPLRQAYRDGEAQRKSEVRLAWVLYGVRAKTGGAAQ